MKKISLTILVCMVLMLPLVAADDVSVNAKVVEAQAALNAPGFDAASAFAISFTDRIDPVTGALTISQTDLTVPGRNGMDVIISRRYSSNIFLNVNENQGQTYCLGNDIDYEKSCQNCMPPTLIQQASGNLGYWYPNGPLNTQLCASPEGEKASFIRSKYLGRGWTMNYLENRYKDVTSLVYGANGPTYRFVPVRGINKQSLVIDNQEKPLVLTSMFRSSGDNFFYWGLDLLFEAKDYRTGEHYDQNYNLDYITCANAPDFICRQSQIFAKDYASDTNGLINGVEYRYVAYTDDLSPAIIINPKGSERIPFGVQPEVVYFGKDGKQYGFTNYVPFCSDFDEIPSDSSGYCSEVNPDFENIMNWAENPYAGTYLTTITDNFGNQIVVNYKKNDQDKNTPFIDQIIATGGRRTTFSYIDENGGEPSNYDINTRVERIKFSDYKGGSILYRTYEYTDGNYGPLLIRSCITKDEYSCDYAITGTSYVYGYDSVSQELTSVKLPSGATIEYTYAWHSDIPSIDATRGEEMQKYSLGIKPARRVVIKRTIKDGGLCPDETGNLVSICSWHYNYEKQGSSGGSVLVKTSVTDPYGYKTEYLAYPTTTPTLAHQF